MSVRIKIFDHKYSATKYRKIESVSIADDERTIIIAID